MPTSPSTTPASTPQRLAAEIITTGTEILLGEIVDTNAAWMAQQLREAGVNLYYKTTVGDNEARLRAVIQLAMSRSNIILISGGLGPTVDDITRQAIANATQSPLELDEGTLATLKERFARFGVTMTENNLQQAHIPQGATIIPNPVGTAPGFIVERQGCSVIALPGVPREMKHLMTETVLPYLRERAGNTGIIRRRVLRAIGIGESSLDHQIGDLMTAANPSVGLAAHTAQVDVRITARAATADAAEALIDGVEAEIRSRVGPHFYSQTAGESIEAVVARQLNAEGQTLALLETNTEGALARRFAALEDVENPVIDAWTVNSTAEVEALPDALAALFQNAPQPNEELATRCVRAMRVSSDATIVLALVGTRGAEDGIFGQGAGQTWLALSGPGGIHTQLHSYGGQDEFTRVRLGNSALYALWRQSDPP